MKKSYLFLIGLFLLSSARAQQTEPALAKAHYLFKYVNDTSNREQFRRDEMVLYLGKNSSYFTSYSSNRAQEDIKKQMDNPAFDGNLKIVRNTSPTQESYYCRPHEHKLTELKDVAGDKFLVDTQWPELDWNIGEETREIGGYKTQKAQTNYKGRNYTAWFTTELPFPFGPWKLQGLPGLILEAYDDKKEVIFEYSGFDKLDNGLLNVELPANAVKSNLKEIKKIQDAFQANPQAYIQAKQAQRQNAAGVSVSGNSISVSATSAKASGEMDMSKIKSVNVQQDDNYKPSKITNNPIELIP